MMESRKITILMYHYVRDLEHSRYPDIKGLETDLFDKQLAYVGKYYTFVSVQQLISAVENNTCLPQRAVLLTFNDCYIDHFNNVFPILDYKGIQGCFYPEIKAIVEDRVLINHKIHFILAAAKNKSIIVDTISSLLNELRADYDLDTFDNYYSKLSEASAYDSKDTIFIKRLLQNELDENVREIITTELFKKFVGVEENVFNKELYLNKEQIKCMLDHGMHFGMLGYNHLRYDGLNKQEQQNELQQARDFLVDVGVPVSELTASYPWGAYNRDTLDILNQLNCKVAFTTAADVADLDKHSPLELPRLDTNAIPKKADASPNKWLEIAEDGMNNLRQKILNDAS